MTDLSTLGERRQHARDELSRVEKFPARILRMSEADRDAAVVSLKQELELIDQEIQAEAQRTQQRQISQVYGTSPVAEDAEKAHAELKLAEAELDKHLDQFIMQTTGYCKKLHSAQVKVFDAAGLAGQPVRRPDAVLNGLAKKLALIVEDAVRYGR